MVHREVVTPSDGGEHRRDHVLGDVVDSLAVRAHEVMVVLGVAGDVRGYVAVALETAGHPVLDLLLQRAVHRGPADRGMRSSDALVELLSRERAFRRSQGLGHDHTLGRAPPATRRKARVDRRGAH